MSLINHLDFITSQRQFKKGNNPVQHELSSNCAAAEPRKFLLYKSDILGSLNDANLVFSTFSLNRNNVVAASFIEADVQLVYFNLTNVFNGCAQVILQTVRG